MSNKSLSKITTNNVRTTHQHFPMVNKYDRITVQIACPLNVRKCTNSEFG